MTTLAPTIEIDMATTGAKLSSADTRKAAALLIEAADALDRDWTAKGQAQP